MDDIRHRVGVDAPIGEVYDACATRDGLAGWWTTDIDGESQVGAELTFRFGGPDRVAVMEVVELTPPERVVWRCVGGPAEWLDTTVTFDLRADGDETVEDLLGRGVDLISLKDGLEGAKARPWPHDVKMSSWD